MNVKSLISIYLIIGFLVPSIVHSDDDKVQSRKIRVWEYPDQEINGDFVSLDESSLQVQPDGQMKKILLNDLIRIRFQKIGPANEKRPGSTLILLENGDRLFLQVEKIEDDLVYGRWQQENSLLEIPLETVQAILFHYSGENTLSRKLISKVFQAKNNVDQYLLLNGDSLSGELNGMDKTTVSLSSRSGDQNVPVRQIAAIVMNRELVSFPETRSVHQIVQFNNGSWLSCHSVKNSGNNRVDLKSIAGIDFSVDLNDVTSILFLSSRVQILSGMMHSEYRHVPYLSQKRELKINRNNHEHFLKMKGVEYRLGLGMYSQSSVTYQLSGQFQKLFGMIGMDDESGEYGSVLFSIEADQRKIYESPRVTRTTPPILLKNINIRGCNELKLNVEFSDNGDVQDLANWCDLILVK